MLVVVAVEPEVQLEAVVLLVAEIDDDKEVLVIERAVMDEKMSMNWCLLL